MTPNHRIHEPVARSYTSAYSTTPTITQSTALWKAMRHREELQRHREEVEADIAVRGMVARLRHAVAALRSFGKRH